MAQCKVQQWKKAKPWLDCKEVCPVRVRGLAQGPGEHQRSGGQWKQERKKGVGRSSQRGRKKVGESREDKTGGRASLKLGQSRGPQRLSRKGRASRCLGRGARGRQTSTRFFFSNHWGDLSICSYLISCLLSQTI